MTIEDRLRRALDARTSSVEPADDGIERITEKLLDQRSDPGPRPGGTGPRPWFLAAAAAVLVAAVAGGFLAFRGDDPHEIGTAEPDTTEAPTTTTAPSTSGSTVPSTPSTAGATTTTTTVPSTSTTTSTPATPGVPADVIAQAAWPRPSSEVRFDDPAAAANSFARYYVRFAAPVVGAFRAGDSRSGEVPVQARTGGPETTVLVRRLSDDHWYVVGASTADIVVDAPANGATLACPQPVRGRALAFEGTVQVQIDGYQPDGDRVALGEGFVTGSGSPPAGPFTGSIPCTRAGGIESSGLVMFREVDESGDGTTALAATVHVVHLG
jgi:hypothetical protein